MRDGYFIGRHRGLYCASLYVNGKREGRFTLGTDNKESAERQVRELNAKRERDRLPSELTVDAIFDLYVKDREAEQKSALYRIKQCRAVIKPHFGALVASAIEKKTCTNYIKLRRNIGVSDATIRTELSYLSAALKFAVDMKLLSSRPRIWRPSQGRPRAHLNDFHLDRAEVDRLLEAAAATPHLLLFIIMALATAGRPLHILQLTWDRVDFLRGTINLDDPDQDRTAKGRAFVPMNDDARRVLLEARSIAETKYVVEFNGKPLKRVKGALERAAKRAGVKVSPYVLRHTSAVWMAEAGVPLEEIAQYLGHTNVEITRKHYARFSPTHLRRAANTLQVVRGSTGTAVPKIRNAK
ncbi:MAG TPA: site-specific integrase [Hyphomicrobiaceae bacterium]